MSRKPCRFRKPYNLIWAPWAWDPITGCTYISEGCANCIAKGQRIKFSDRTLEGCFVPTVHPQEFNQPIMERVGKSVIVGPKGDLFHKDFSFKLIRSLLDVMRQASQHTYYLLTKRQDRMLKCLIGYKHWPLPKVNIGMSVENQKRLEERMPVLSEIPIHDTAHRYLSCEPMLGPMSMGSNISDLGAVICGPERGRIRRPFKMEWLESLKSECSAADIPFYHHGSGIVDLEQRPSSDHEIRELQCERRLMEHFNGGVALLPALKEIMEREHISFVKLTRLIGPAVRSKSCLLSKGIASKSTYKKINEFLKKYQKQKGLKHEISNKSRQQSGGQRTF